MDFSPEWLKAQRKAHGLSQADLAQRIGANQATISQWETGKQRPDDAQLAHCYIRPKICLKNFIISARQFLTRCFLTNSNPARSGSCGTRCYQS